MILRISGASKLLAPLPANRRCCCSMSPREEFYHRYAVENADEEAVTHLMELQGLHSQSFPPDVFATYRRISLRNLPRLKRGAHVIINRFFCKIQLE